MGQPLTFISCYFEFNWSHGVGLYSGLTHPDSIADHVTSAIHGHLAQDHILRIYSCDSKAVKAIWTQNSINHLWAKVDLVGKINDNKVSWSVCQANKKGNKMAYCSVFFGLILATKHLILVVVDIARGTKVNSCKLPN